ncbi:hypothetical protein QN372_17825 [Undibacterium sp. RTI2.1]|uniref:hypothetical protein n=1 Tax=unclassified Undibacterium TaxID=2630295 RepID=UPI002AB48A58|nr:MULTISPECIES: hypothetical protein [unclassified Undibacterium]MDY7537456.1 hypothetical protein [Undibacterium sp. 5I1]MEB0032610.1 hypothetical protein [Undibacterium sp. RTI2.1]MEB0118583.1 hypothetical protein [Undibacterium sp. RTI2.2]MEB0258198.1 hypothetical protein [Undibacterium sp. 5I1]
MKYISICVTCIIAASFSLNVIAAEDQFLVQQAHKNQLAHESKKTKTIEKSAEDKKHAALTSEISKDSVSPKTSK